MQKRNNVLIAKNRTPAESDIRQYRIGCFSGGFAVNIQAFHLHNGGPQSVELGRIRINEMQSQPQTVFAGLFRVANLCRQADLQQIVDPNVHCVDINDIDVDFVDVVTSSDVAVAAG